MLSGHIVVGCCFVCVLHIIVCGLLLNCFNVVSRHDAWIQNRYIARIAGCVVGGAFFLNRFCHLGIADNCPWRTFVA